MLTCFSPENPTDRILQRTGNTLVAMIKSSNITWTAADRRTAFDCIAYLVNDVESANSAQVAPPRVRFTMLSELQSDAIYVAYYAGMHDEVELFER